MNISSPPLLPSDSIVAPFHHIFFRRIWTAGLLSNFGLLIQGVGAAWAMTVLTGRPNWVALVQSALMLPTTLLSVAAGALADMYDRRLVGLAALSLSFIAAAGLSAISVAGKLEPYGILIFCFLIGSGMAIFGPSWQASVAEQVPINVLPAAVALNSISYNLARSFGPAIGGLIVAVAGVAAAFVTNALLCLPLLTALFFWRRERSEARLPPERIGWTLSRDIADPELWIERYHCPTWHDYLRQRERLTAAERLLERTATAFHFGDQPFRVRRLLERPFGSVRWKENTPDPSGNMLLPSSPPTGGK